jgi:carbamate kinase
MSNPSHIGSQSPRAVVALGGNALLRRGQPLTTESQTHAARTAAGLLAQASSTHRLVVTHGNGPQVGLLALMADAYDEATEYPLDVLGSETEGQIGYALALEIGNAIPALETVTVFTRVVVDAGDPAFAAPSKFIGPVYSEREARSLARRHHWAVRRDGQDWRRVVPSPRPQRIVELRAIERLVDTGFLVVCAGGGGIPVVEEGDGRQRGVEAVIDKDLASALLAIDLGVDALVLATDVDAVYDEYGAPTQQRIAQATPLGLRSHEFAPGSMGPKVEAACQFVERTGGRAVIGSLDQLDELLSGRAGTQVRPDGPILQHGDRRARDDRAA